MNFAESDYVRDFKLEIATPALIHVKCKIKTIPLQFILRLGMSPGDKATLDYVPGLADSGEELPDKMYELITDIDGVPVTTQVTIFPEVSSRASTSRGRGRAGAWTREQ